MTAHRNAGRTEERARYALYLHREKHAELCSFLEALPVGSVSSFLQEALRLYIASKGDTAPLNPMVPDAAPRRSHRRAPPQSNQVSSQAPRSRPRPASPVAAAPFQPAQPVQPAAAAATVPSSMPAPESPLPDPTPPRSAGTVVEGNDDPGDVFDYFRSLM